MIDIGKGIKDIDCIENAIKDKNRTMLGQTAEPQGLFLMNVNYDEFAID